MTYNKDAFQIWTPARAWAWTRFAKAALFNNEQDFVPSSDSRNLAGRLLSLDLPYELQAYDYTDNIVIIDLPGVESIQYGLQLYQQAGLQPIPMFNAVVGAYTDGRKDVVDNAPIVKALAASTYVLNTSNVPESQFASFLLDYNRDSAQTFGTDVYDNRYNLTPNDLPDSQYLRDANVQKVLYITTGTPHNDIADILSTYQKNGIQVQIFQHGQFSNWTWDSLELSDLPAVPVSGAPERAMLVKKHHPARRILAWTFGALAAISVLNFFTQWNFGAPALWTVPGAQWLVYDIVPESVGDVFLILFTLLNVIIWIGVAAVQSDKMIKVGLVVFLLDLIWFFGYVLNYGPMAFAETPAYALFAFGLPIALGITLLLSFFNYRRHLNSPTPPGWYKVTHNDWEQRYWNGTAWDDRLRYHDEENATFVYYTVRTRPTRIYGYSGYGGSGRGGYGHHHHSSSYASMGG